uniref:Secreted protein n=1 Tax=Ixodes ricinus TaxID=34613 RepID=A0A6B0UY64_IXORI
MFRKFSLCLFPVSGLSLWSMMLHKFFLNEGQFQGFICSRVNIINSLTLKKKVQIGFERIHYTMLNPCFRMKQWEKGVTNTKFSSIEHSGSIHCLKHALYRGKHCSESAFFFFRNRTLGLRLMGNKGRERSRNEHTIEHNSVRSKIVQSRESRSPTVYPQSTDVVVRSPP